MQGLPRLTLQNVRNFERPPCAKRGLAILNYRLVQDWKRVRVGRGSAILEALYGVGGYMRAPTGDKKLMIYSDMLEESAWQKFGPSIATPKARAAALNKLAKSGHIATLSGVTVCIAGFDAGDVASKQPAAVKSFWQEYFRTSRSDACIYRHRVSDLRRLRDYAQLTWSSRHAHRTNRRRLARRLALPAAIGVVGAGARNGSNPSVAIARVIDGDTVALSDGRRVRLLQIDTPELGAGECYSRAARTALVNACPDR